MPCSQKELPFPLLFPDVQTGNLWQLTEKQGPNCKNFPIYLAKGDHWSWPFPKHFSAVLKWSKTIARFSLNNTDYKKKNPGLSPGAVSHHMHVHTNRFSATCHNLSWRVIDVTQCWMPRKRHPGTFFVNVWGVQRMMWLWWYIGRLVKFSLYFKQLRIISQKRREHWKRNHYLEFFQGSVFFIIFMQWMDITQNISSTLLGYKHAY